MDTLSKIRAIIGDGPDAIWSVTDIAYSEFKNDFTRAIIIAQHYKNFISNEEYDEEKYHRIMLEARTAIDEKINLLKQLFDLSGIKNYIPPMAQTDELALVAPFSFKYAAVQAGLGWIGKSGVLITKEFGPRVRLAAILLDYPLDCGSPITKSLCGSCQACVDACLWGVIKGVNWNISSKRDELLDYKLCNTKRSEYIVSNGRKHTCGYCILACPWGVQSKRKCCDKQEG
jgi:epoxyqueuosine reductase QueG